MSDHDDEMTQAERIRRLEHRCDMEAHHIAELRTQINLLRAERDEARREICAMASQENYYADKPEIFPMQIAKERGWDCFDSQQFSVEGELE